MDNFITIAFTLFLVIDALGTLPSYLAQIKELKPRKAVTVCIRELFFALILMFGFFYLGKLFLNLLGVSKSTVELSGGFLLFLIATRLIFSHDEHVTHWKPGRSFIVPIATPLLAGPSFFAVVTIYGQSGAATVDVLWAIVLAWGASACVYLFGRPIFNLIRESGLLACQRLMGLLISLVAVEWILEGIRDLIKHGL